MPNGINDISPSLRDFLLNRNLILADTITDGGLQGLAVGLGQQANIETPPNAVQASAPITENGAFYRQLNLLVNPYGNPNPEDEEIDINTSSVGNIGNLPPGGQPVQYQWNIGSERTDSTFNVEADKAREQLLKNKFFDEQYFYKVNLNTIIVSDKSDGVYDFKSNVAARRVDFILETVGLGGVSQQFNNAGLPTSPLGQIANEQLVAHVGYNAAFGLAEETLGNINLNPLSLLRGNSIIVPNYQITVPKNEVAGVFDYAARVLGFEIPVSLLDDSSSIFSRENPVVNTARIESMVLNTGVGQVQSMIVNLNENKYKPTITDDRNRVNVTKGDTGTNGELYAFESGAGSGTIQDLLNTENRLTAAAQAALEAGTGAESNDGENSDKAFERSNGKITSELDGGFNDDFGDGPNENVFAYGLDGDAIDQYIWGDEANNKGGLQTFGESDKFTVKKSLLYKTQQLFKTNKMKTLVTGKGVKGQVKSDTQSAVHFNYTSKGSGVLTPSAVLPEVFGALDNPTAEEVFCRTWTTSDRYDNIFNLQKSSGLLENVGNTLRRNLEGSVLDDNGFVRIAPNIGDDQIDPQTNETNIKRFMFSIENLAWNGFTNFLPTCEKGPGDLITGTKGRIMWFPPYDVNFTDNSAVNWDTTNFIGRGEPIYTYNNTERTGTLQWKIIIDHATYMNDVRDFALGDASDELFASIAAGCTPINEVISSKISPIEKDKIEVATVQEPKKINVDPEQIPLEFFKVYFPNDVPILAPEDYENGDGEGLGKIMATEGYITSEVNGSIHTYPDTTDFALNGGTNDGKSGQPLTMDGVDYHSWNDSTESFEEDLVVYILTKCPSCRVSLSGYASQDGENAAPDANQRLSNDRASNYANKLKTLLRLSGDKQWETRFEFVEGKGNVGPDDGAVDSINKKLNRFTKVSFRYDETLDERLVPAEVPVEAPVTPSTIAFDLRRRFFNECAYFEKIKQTDKFVYNKLKEKVRFFQPAFHSMTPEGFNSRLNFLKQCTRQGPTVREGVPSNLAFGTPPVCILRIGDFYHTKIIIDNVGFSFDPLVWDLNPEGVGVQPMICTVDMSFKFIGGSSLQGPINRLQNAVSFNFFANTEIYDERADSIKKITNVDPNTGEETTDYKIVNGVNPNNFDKPEDGFDYLDGLSDGITNTPSLETAQEERAEDDNSSSETDVDEDDSASTEPVINGFKFIKTIPIGTSEGGDLKAWSVEVALKDNNITDDDGIIIQSAFEDVIAQPIKLVFEQKDSGFRYEQILTENDDLIFTNQGGFSLGVATPPNSTGIIGLEVGEYHLCAFQAGNAKANANVTITNDEWIF